MSTYKTSYFSKIDTLAAHNLFTEFFNYGTAGFRGLSDLLDSIVYRMGLLAVIRSKYFQGQVVGLMITASHNPEEDNGVKLIDPHGEMLGESWEGHASKLANASDEELIPFLNNLIRTYNISWINDASVYVGRDTRSSSKRLAECALKAIEHVGGESFDYGIVTTPMLHYFVAETNIKSLSDPPSENEYFKKLSNAFLQLNKSQTFEKYSTTLNFDGANGVGALAMNKLLPFLNKQIHVNVFNHGLGRLNYMCGADFVKVNLKAPDGLPVEAFVRGAAVDGDADRLMYFYLSNDLSFHLLDGDRIAILLASYIIELLQIVDIELKIGIIQTAYANSASTNYIKKVLHIEAACTETGVKYLHHKALEYDVGVYFEANGHGTIVYSPHAVNIIKSLSLNADISEEKRKAAIRLSDFIELTNQTVGDALSDLLLVETVLRARDWSLVEWENCYTDFPSRLLTILVQDRSYIKTIDSSRCCVEPAGLQAEINKAVKKFKNGRSFVRPSGTENVVRIYAEAETQEDADKLGAEVCLLVYRMARGIGKPPVVPS